MNGGDVLCRTLIAHEIDTCFANPGTSEMHFVASLDKTPEMRCVLGLFEGVVTGAADGYARMTGRPAATLLHTGPGMANALANMHNARRARSPMVNIVGDHASSHLLYDAPLTTEIEALARPMADWVATARTTATLQEDTIKAIEAAETEPGQVSVLVLPADVAWGTAVYDAHKKAKRSFSRCASVQAVDYAARTIRSGQRCLLLLGDGALRTPTMRVASQISASNEKIDYMAEQSNARMQQGRGSHAPERVAYSVDQAIEQLEDYDTIVLVGAREPVAFFKYPEKAHRVSREDVQFVQLTLPGDDHKKALEDLREALGVRPDALTRPVLAPIQMPCLGQNVIDPITLLQVVASLLPEHAIVCDEAITYSTAYGEVARSAKPHDLLQLTGGAIGIGPSLAVGAAIACPERKVLSLQADGAGLYTVQALWTQAREQLDVVTVILSNRRYHSLYGELQNLGHGTPGQNAIRMLELDKPQLDWGSIAVGLGVPGYQVHTLDELHEKLRRALHEPGPMLIEAVMVD